MGIDICIILKMELLMNGIVKSSKFIIITITSLSFFLRHTEQKNLNTAICEREGDIVYQGRCVQLNDALFKEMQKDILKNNHNYSAIFRKCGKYSRSSRSDRFHCACLDGYARATSQVLDSTSPCHKIEVYNVRVEAISRDSIRVLWHVPTVFVGRISITVAFHDGSVSSNGSYRRTKWKVSFNDAVTFTNITFNKQTVYTIDIRLKIRGDFKTTFNNSSTVVFYKLKNQTGEEYLSTTTAEEKHSPSLKTQLDQHQRDALRLFLTSFLPPVGALVIILLMICRLYKSRTRSGGDISRKYHIVKEQQEQNGRRDNDECFVKQIASSFYT